MAAARGMMTQLGIGATVPVTTRLDFQREGLKNTEEIIDGNGLRGTLSSNVDRTRVGLQRIGGTISLMPNVVELAAVLQWVLGGTPTGVGTVTYPVSDTLFTRAVSVDRIAKVFSYPAAGVDKATFRASQGECLTVDLDLVGTTESVGNAGTFPALSIDTASGPWIYSDAVITIGGTTVTPKNIEISVSNVIDRDRYFNSNTIASLVNHDRQVMFSCLLPYGDQSAIYDSGSGGVTVVCTFTNGTNILTFSMVEVVFPKDSPNAEGRSEIMLPISGRAYQTASTKEIVTTIQTP